MNTSSHTPTKSAPHAATRALSILTGVLVAILACGAFALSFDSLNKLAVENGVTVGLTWVWPLVLDGSIVVFSLSALRSRLYGESITYAMTLVVLTTLASVLFNVAHAPSGPLAHTMAAVPPIALFLSFELLMRQVGSSVERSAVLSSQTELLQNVDKLESSRQKLLGQIEGLSGQVQRQRDDNKRTNPTSKRKQAIPKKDRIRERQVQIVALHSEGISVPEIAKRLSVSSKTVKRDLQAASASASSSMPN
jgi:hypothetical protein